MIGVFVVLVVVLIVVGISVALGLMMARGDTEGWGPDGPPKSVREERRLDELLRERGLIR